MVKNKTILIILVLIAITIMSACDSDRINMDRKICEANSGKWLEETNACFIEETVPETLNQTNNTSVINQSEEIEEPKPLINLKKVCELNLGNWIETHVECEWISEDVCNEMNGTFDGCSSACRHNDPDEELNCIMVCVPLCTFD